ncbi:MAG: hypothetical protein JKY56_09420 [Kofleriaceae bacterium]|nr:hypothetical protein [Kofleriaceae bacterium]
MPRSTMTLTSETNVTHTPLLDEDIELIEESGLLEVDASQNDTEHIVELTQSILIDDVEGNPNTTSDTVVSTAPESLGEEIILDDEILAEEEIEEPEIADDCDDSSATMVVAISEVSDIKKSVEEKPDAPKKRVREVTTTAVIATAEVLSELPKAKSTTPHEAALASGMAQYSDGSPNHVLERTRTATVRSQRKWDGIAVIGAVFAVGIGAGVFFASRSSAPESVVSPAATKPVAAVTPQVAPLEQIEVAPLVIEEVPVAPASNVATEAVAPDSDAAEVDQSGTETSGGISAAVQAEPTTPALAPFPKKAAIALVEPVTPSPKATPNPAVVATDKAALRTTPKTKTAARTKPVKKPTVKPASLTPKAPAKNAAPGTLMLGAKPPSLIFIDGKATGLTTPQKNIRLAPGRHRITLVNNALGIRDSFSVTVISGKKIKRIRTNTNKIK